MTAPQAPLTAEHELKCWPEYYRDVIAGIKTFEIRRNDRPFKVGDILWLREWSPRSETYSNRSCRMEITYITDFEQQPGMVVLGITALRSSEPVAEPFGYYIKIGGEWGFTPAAQMGPEHAMRAEATIVELFAAPPAQRDAEDAANTALATEAVMLRGLLSELVDAVDGCDNMDEMDGEEFQLASNRLIAATKEARKQTEAAMLASPAAPATQSAQSFADGLEAAARVLARRAKGQNEAKQQNWNGGHDETGNQCAWGAQCLADAEEEIRALRPAAQPEPGLAEELAKARSSVQYEYDTCDHAETRLALAEQLDRIDAALRSRL